MFTFDNKKNYKFNLIVKLNNKLRIIIKLKTSESYIKYVINQKCEIMNINNYIHGT